MHIRRKQNVHPKREERGFEGEGELGTSPTPLPSKYKVRHLVWEGRGVYNTIVDVVLL